MRYILLSALAMMLALSPTIEGSAQKPGKVTRPTTNPVSPSKPSGSTKPTPKPQPKPSAKPLNQSPLSNRAFTVSGVPFTMVAVDGGTFQMGNGNGGGDVTPVHSVTLSSYYIGQTEVTQALWTAVMGSNPSYFKGDNLPVEKVSWHDCQSFITKLNALIGENFRLPTEAEWEFAAKGGNKSKGYTYSGSNNIDDVAWYRDNSGSKTHPVGTKAPNELGIYDMSGNVYEWCQDGYGFYPSSAQTNPAGSPTGDSRMMRGGSWFGISTFCRAVNRLNDSPTGTLSSLGFRLALSK